MKIYGKMSFKVILKVTKNQGSRLGLNPGGQGEHLIFIASAKMQELEGSILPSNFYGQLPDYWSHVFRLIYPVGECYFKEIKTWDRSEISFYCFVFGVN